MLISFLLLLGGGGGRDDTSKGVIVTFVKFLGGQLPPPPPPPTRYGPDSRTVTNSAVIRETTTRLQNKYSEYWKNKIYSSSRLELFSKIKENFVEEPFLDEVKNYDVKRNFFKFRTSNHSLFIETGRYCRPILPTTYTLHSIYSALLQSTLLYSTSYDLTPLHSTLLRSTPPHFTSPHSTLLNCSLLYSAQHPHTRLHFAPLHSTPPIFPFGLDLLTLIHFASYVKEQN